MKFIIASKIKKTVARTLTIKRNNKNTENDELDESLTSSDKEQWVQLRDRLKSVAADGVAVPGDTSCTQLLKPKQMRLLALVSHNEMKPTMQKFIQEHKNVLKHFRLTGTKTTMMMVKNAYGDGEDIYYGPTCDSGPLGGDAQLSSLVTQGEIGGVLFFIDPLSAHPHQADIDQLVRMCNVRNILLSTNPTSAACAVYTLKCAMESGKKDLIPSFFVSVGSPGVDAYTERQAAFLEGLKSGKDGIEKRRSSMPDLNQLEKLRSNFSFGSRRRRDSY